MPVRDKSFASAWFLRRFSEGNEGRDEGSGTLVSGDAGSWEMGKRHPPHGPEVLRGRLRRGGAWAISPGCRVPERRRAGTVCRVSAWSPTLRSIGLVSSILGGIASLGRDGTVLASRCGLFTQFVPDRILGPRRADAPEAHPATGVSSPVPWPRRPGGPDRYASLAPRRFGVPVPRRS